MTVKEASAQIGMGYDSLAELLRKYPAVRSWLGAWRDKGAWVYPDTSLHQFQWIAARHTEGWTLAAIAKGTEQMAYEQTPNALVPTSEQMPVLDSPNEQISASISPNGLPNEQQARAFADLLTEAMLKANDDIWTLKEAKERYPALTWDELRTLRVSVGRRKLVRKSDVMRYLASLKQAE